MGISSASDTAESPAAAWEIVGTRHGGITVSDMDRSLEFYCDIVGLELLWRRVFEEPEVGRIVGVTAATSFDIAMLRIPNSDVDIELLQYHGVETHSGASEPSSYGTGHFCVFVRGIEELYVELRDRGVSFRSEGPVEMLGGPNKGGKSLYSLDPDGYIFEFHEPPPHLRRP